MKSFGWKIGVQLVLPIVSTIWRKIKIRKCVNWSIHVEFLLHLNKLLVCVDLAYNHCRSGVKPVLFSWIFAHVNLHCSLLLILIWHHQNPTPGLKFCFCHWRLIPHWEFNICPWVIRHFLQCNILYSTKCRSLRCRGAFSLLCSILIHVEGKCM
jgi:hypothetical protein